MKNEVTGKEMITKFLDRVAITARVGVETGEFTKEEILDYITQYGNKRIIKLLEMSEEKFAMVAVMGVITFRFVMDDTIKTEDDIRNNESLRGLSAYQVAQKVYEQNGRVFPYANEEEWLESLNHDPF